MINKNTDIIRIMRPTVKKVKHIDYHYIIELLFNHRMLNLAIILSIVNISMVNLINILCNLYELNKLFNTFNVFL